MMTDGPIAHRFARGPERRRDEPTSTKHQTRSKIDRRVESLQWIPLFQDTDEEAVRAAIGESEVLELSVGEEILRLGQTNDCVFILLSGSLEAHLATEKRPDQAIPVVPGQCIGELSVIDGQPVSASVVVASDARILKLSAEVFWDRLMLVPGVARNLALTLSARMRRTNDRALGALREQLALEHLRRELDAARQLQLSMVPLQSPMFPDRHDIEVCGLMEPASRVGGDFFDAFFLDDDKLFFCVGDVSGHGIASALFMARIIGLVRVLAMTTTEPDRLLELLNRRLCVGNESNLFVTMFCAVLDPGSGRLQYSNGGHCPPIIYASGHARLMDLPRGALIGAFSEARYSSMETDLAVGDILVCYTDGITEANSETGEEFGEQRCIEILARTNGGSSAPALMDLLAKLVAEASAFTGAAHFEDDCTMLAMRRLPI